MDSGQKGKMQPNLVLVGSILSVYIKRWYFHTPHGLEKLKFPIILNPERNILIWSAWAPSSVSAKRNYVNGFWAKKKMQPNLVLVGPIHRVYKKRWYFHTPHGIENLSIESSFTLSAYRNLNFLEKLHQFIFSCGDKAELSGRFLLAEMTHYPHLLSASEIYS